MHRPFQQKDYHSKIALVVTKMADSSEVITSEVCMTQYLNILLMHSCTQCSGSALHLDFLCLSALISFEVDIFLAFLHVEKRFLTFFSHKCITLVLTALRVNAGKFAAHSNTLHKFRPSPEKMGG